MNCLSSICKYVLYCFNLIFVIVGILLIVFGSLMLTSIENVSDFDGAVTPISFEVITIVIGCVTFLVAFFGCCGTIRENPCLTKLYAICMVILFGVQLAFSIWLFVESDVFVDMMSDLVDMAWADNDAAHAYPMDAIQLAFNCCGNEGYQQYGNEVPASCCGLSDRSLPCEASIYTLQPGCKSEFVDFWTSNMDIIRWGNLVIALVELGIGAFSCHLAKMMNNY